MRKHALQNRSAAAMAVLSCCFALATTPLAAQGSDSNGQSAAVIAHLPLPGPSATQMLLRRGQAGNLRLYVDQGKKQGVVVVDVTNPSRPSVVNRAAWPGRAADGQVQLLGSEWALSELQESPAAAPGAPPASQTVSVLDTTDPAHPQVLQTFFGVTSVLPDADRNLIFIANAEGLWIVRHRGGQSAYAMRHLCTSEAALNPEPNCY